MRTLEYELLPPVGTGTHKTSGTLTELVRAIPYLLIWNLVPPLSVLNSIFSGGRGGAGMSGGCRWQPFQITPDEYEELARSLDGLERVEVPEWVQTSSDWTIWAMHLKRGVPAEEHRRLTDESEQLARKAKEARERGEVELAEDLFVQSVQAGTRLGEFVMSHARSRGDERP
jgi:hypothetical protein